MHDSYHRQSPRSTSLSLIITPVTNTLSTRVKHVPCKQEGCCRPWSTTHELSPALLEPPLGSSVLLFKSLSLLTRNVTNFASDILLHSFIAPKRPTWDIRLALFVSFFQQAVQHQHLADVTRVRRFTTFPAYVPSSQVVITPTSFRVLPRGLPGLLAESDAREDGSREITAEWVVDRSLWVRNQEQFHEVGVKDEFGIGKGWRSSGRQEDDEHAERVILYIHGGAYTYMSAKTHRDLTFRISRSTGLRVFAINYRLAPENPFPAALADAVYSFLYLIDPNGMGIKPSNVIVMGDSAGGGLSLALMLYLRDHHMSNVGAGCLLSPWVDLTFSSPTWKTNTLTDYLPAPPPMTYPIHPTRMYLGASQFPHLASHPYVSPLFAQTFTNLPPLLIQCGDAECLHGEIRDLAERMRCEERTRQGAGVHLQFEEFEDMVHVFQAFSFLPEAERAIRNIGYFVCNVVPIVQKHRAEVSHLRKALQDFTHSSLNAPPISPTVTTFKYLSPADGVRASKSHPDLRQLYNMAVMGGGLAVPSGIEVNEM